MRGTLRDGFLGQINEHGGVQITDPIHLAGGEQHFLPSDPVSGFDLCRGFTGIDDRRHTILPADDGRMAQGATGIGYDTLNDTEHRRPGRVGAGADQDFARLNFL